MNLLYRLLFLASAPLVFAPLARADYNSSDREPIRIGDQPDLRPDLKNWDGSFDVRGELRGPNQTISISRLHFNLRDSGYFLASSRENVYAQFRGRWSREGDSLRLDIQSAFGLNASGSGRLTFTGRGRDLAFDQISFSARVKTVPGYVPVSVDLDAYGSDANIGEELYRKYQNGRNDDSQPWYERHHDDNDDHNGDNRPGFETLDQLFTTKSGRGTLRIENQRDDSDLDTAKVELTRDGAARVTLRGDREWVFEGKWRQNSRQRIDLNFDTLASGSRPNARALQSDSIGQGTLWLDGTSLRSLYLSGRLGKDDFNAQFDVQGSDSGSNGGWHDGDSGGWHDNDGDTSSDSSDELFSGVNQTFRTLGSVGLEGAPNDPVSRVYILLRRDRSAQIEIVAREHVYDLRGQWRPSSTGDYKLELRPAWGYDLVRGEVGTKGNTNHVDELTLTGRFADRAFSASLNLH